MAQVDTKTVRKAREAFRKFPKELKNDFRKAQRQALKPIWQESVAESVRGGEAVQEKIFSKGNRVKAGIPAVVTSGTSTRYLSGGLVPADEARSFEFGAKDRGYAVYNRVSKKGGRHKVRRRTRNQMPIYRRMGWVVYPAFFDKALPRFVRLHVQTMVYKIYKAVE